MVHNEVKRVLHHQIIVVKSDALQCCLTRGNQAKMIHTVAAMMLVPTSSMQYLVEDRVVRGINLVPAVHVTHAKEGGDPLLDEFALVRRRVRAQHLSLSTYTCVNNKG